MTKITRALLCASMLAASSAGHAVVMIQNGSFETGANPGSFETLVSGDNTSIAGWTVLPYGVDYIGTYWDAGEGNRSVDLGGDLRGGVYQDVMLDEGKEYYITFKGSANPDSPNDVPNPRIVNFKAGAYEDGFAYTLITSGPNANSQTNMRWQNYMTQKFTASAGGLTRISFTGGNTQPMGGAYGFALDSVSISAVPEPATWAMMLIGFAAVGSAVRRRRTSLAVTYA